MTILCVPSPSDVATLPAAAAPLARALRLPLAATLLFDAAEQSDPASPADVESAWRAATEALAATLPPGVQSAGLALRLNGEPPWAPPVRLAIATGARLLAIDAREGPGLSSLGEIVRAAPVPVLAIGPRYVQLEGAPVRIVTLTDGSSDAATIGPALAALLAGTDVPVQLLAIEIPALGEHPTERDLELALGLETLAAAMPQVTIVHRRIEPARAFESVAAAVIRVAREHGATHIALATHGRGRALRFLLGSVAEALVRSSPLPLLLVAPTGGQSSD